jgi:hypothetical protein
MHQIKIRNICVITTFSVECYFQLKKTKTKNKRLEIKIISSTEKNCFFHRALILSQIFFL